MEQPHHWYDPHNVGTPILVDLLESAADAAATTLGRYEADPWTLYWWYPPQQSAEWWEDVYSRSMAFDWAALNTPLQPERVPGWRMNDAATNQERDD